MSILAFVPLNPCSLGEALRTVNESTQVRILPENAPFSKPNSCSSQRGQKLFGLQPRSLLTSFPHIWRLESLRQEQIEPDYVKKARRDISSSVTGYFTAF